LKNAALIGKGRTADVYAWGEGRILKLYHGGLPATLIEHEYSVTRAAQAAGVPVPAVFELVEIEERRGIVFERIEGISLLAELQAKPWKLLTVARRLGELHAQIHGSRAADELPSQRKQIENGIAAARDMVEADKTAVRNHLLKLPEGESLCHGDFHPDNILLSARGPVIIDWMTGTRGNPLADVARTLLLFQTAGLPPGTPLHVRLPVDFSRALLRATYLNRYLRLRPAGRREIDLWRPPLMAARLREVADYPKERRLLLARMKSMLKEPSPGQA
jgi:uncharacterized protein (TIGR02172 family)